MRIAFKTFGCKANSVDTDALLASARLKGVEIVPESEIADAYVINSCTVTSAADRDARGQAIRYKKRNPNALVGVVGCYAQVAKEELLALPEIDVVIGTAEKHRVVDFFLETWRGLPVERDQVQEAKGFLREDFPGSRYSRASVKIQDGCNFKCSFCIIPRARGRSRSLRPEIVLKQIDDAYAQGFHEVVLTGIHIAHYGWDLNTDLLELLQAVFRKKDGPRIRVSTLDPFEIPDALIDLMAREERFCPHFHIAIQSGSDKVLRAMRRIYKAREFVEVTNKIRDRNPDTFVGVDVIVGFPGETEADFEQTVECLEASHWTKLHVFPFSARHDTVAAELPDPVPPEEIARRSRVLRHWSDRQLQAFASRQVGRECEVVLERASRKHPHLWQGHTENYLATYSLAPETLGPRNRLRSRIVRAENGRVWTEPV